MLNIRKEEEVFGGRKLVSYFEGDKELGFISLDVHEDLTYEFASECHNFYVYDGINFDTSKFQLKIRLINGFLNAIRVTSYFPNNRFIVGSGEVSILESGLLKITNRETGSFIVDKDFVTEVLVNIFITRCKPEPLRVNLTRIASRHKGEPIGSFIKGAWVGCFANALRVKGDQIMPYVLGNLIHHRTFTLESALNKNGAGDHSEEGRARSLRIELRLLAVEVIRFVISTAIVNYRDHGVSTPLPLFTSGIKGSVVCSDGKLYIFMDNKLLIEYPLEILRPSIVRIISRGLRDMTKQDYSLVANKLMEALGKSTTPKIG